MTYEQLARIEYLEGQIDALEEQQDALEAQITKYRIVIEELQRKLQAAQSERHAAEQGVEELRAHPTTTEIWRAHADLKRENEKLLRDREGLVESLTHALDARDAAQGERDALDEKCDALKSAIEKRDQTLAELREWVSMCEGDSNAARAERDRWRDLYRVVEEKRDALAERVTELERWLHPSGTETPGEPSPRRWWQWGTPPDGYDKHPGMRVILGPGEQVTVAVPFPDDRSADDQSSTGSESA